MDQQIISADDHLDLRWLPRDLWIERLPSGLREQAPRVVESDQGLHWHCEGKNWGRWGNFSGQGGKWAIEVGGGLAAEAIRPTTPQLRLEDMDRDGIHASVMYGHTDGFRIDNPALRSACYSAYNDWQSDFASYAPERLIKVAQLPADDPAAATREFERVAQLGYRHVNILAAIAPVPVFAEPWDRFWAIAGETGIPVGFHLAVQVEPPKPHRTQAVNMAMFSIMNAQQLAEPIVGLIFNGVLDRYPGCKVVLAESGLCWIPRMISRADASWRRMYGGRLAGVESNQAKELPSEYFKRQVWCTFQDDPTGMQMLKAGLLYEDKVMWASDYPHPASTWPESQRIIEAQTEGIAPELKQKLLCGNARALYGL